jgi:cell wall-associated NlpC family hydrolase
VNGAEADAAAHLLERLLQDPVLRARFRRDPVGASREAGVDSVAREMALGAGKALETLDVRESRSSLAGVFMAAALEGAAAYDFSQQIVPHIEDLPESVAKVLSRIDLPLVAPEAQAAPPHSNDAGEFRAVSLDPSVPDLLHNGRITFDADGIADLRGGKVDSRIVSVLSAISRDHRIGVSTIRSDHDRLTTGGSVSNHFYGRAVDISTVDGQPVGPGNAAAREIAVALARFDPAIRPTEIGSPWSLPGSQYFTDGEHQNHLHIAFDDPARDAPQPAPQPASQPAMSLPAVDDEAVDTDDDTDDEPGGLEDPGGDTDAEADEESDGSGDEAEDDSESDDASDDEEDSGDGADEDDGDDSGDGSDSSSDSSSDSGSDSGDPGVDLGDVDGSYPGDDASQAQIAGWMGSQAQKRGLPPELPVMAGLVESGLRNLNHGDADSVGFFQMRLSIWNKDAYAGYPDHADLQLKWFLDKAVAVKEQRVAAGQPIDDPNSYGDWVANVENPASAYRGRYQLRLDEARGLLKAGAGSGNGVVEQVDAVDLSASAGPRAMAAVAEARKYMGTPYQWGGSTPQSGFDCSGLVQWAYAKAGIRIPRTSEQQILAPNGKAVDRGHLQPGDLVFFRNSGGDVHHVGISLGGDRFINAPHTGADVRINSLKESYFADEFAGGRRFDMSAPRQTEGDAANVPAVDRNSVRDAQLALVRDAAEVQRPGTLLFEAVKAQEVGKGAPSR